ncbi:asparaginase [Neisseriaceae bacterium TC5R-5]|nr:asparaginase [Neisseriaceae bacterium TC5R-5]
MRRILVLHTGGTIGMEASPAGLVPVPGLVPSLLERYRRPGLDLTVLELAELIDSSAITPRHWNQIIAQLAEHYHHYDGFVLTHGTDTMAYTASVLAFALQGLAKPVVLTGAQLPLLHPRSDGWGNLADALEAACQSDLHEVSIAFNRLLLRGCRARKLSAEQFAGFDSPNCPPLAQFAIQTHWQRQHWRTAQRPFQAQSLNDTLKLACLFLTPGYGAQLAGQAMLTQELDAAVVMSFGNGNAPADPLLLEGVANMHQRGAPVVNISQVLQGAVAVGAYAASQALAGAGALSGRDLTPEAALAKLHYLLSTGLSAQPLLAALDCSLAGEMSD